MTEKPRGASSGQRSRALLTAAAGLTDVGRQRRHNEDHILVRPEHGLFVVADGMGGHNAGNVASALVTTSIDNFFLATKADTPQPVTSEDTDLSEGARRILTAVRKSNHDVFEISSTHQQHHGMGSTIVAAYIPPGGDEIHIAHVGDSRCYRVRDGEIKQLTRDHSLINDALDIKPDLTEADLARLPKNIITRALGMKDVVKVDVRSEKLEPGDLFLLCSDGLSGMVNDADLGDVLGMSEQAIDACEVLIAMANDAGGTDNISAVVVRVFEPAARTSVRPGARPPSIAPRSTPPPPDIAVSDDDSGADVFADEGPASASIQRMVKDSVPPPPVRAGHHHDAQDIGALAEMLDDDEPERLTIPFDLVPSRCSKCRADLLIGARFCVECGASMQPSR